MNPLAHVTQTLFLAQPGHTRALLNPCSCQYTHAHNLINIHKQYSQIFIVYTHAHVHPSKDTNKHRQMDAYMQTRTRTLARIRCTHTHKHKYTKTHTKHGSQRPACGRWTFYVLRQKRSWSRDKTSKRKRARAKLRAKYRMFDLTKRYFQNRIQKFQPSGHNYLISKLRFSSFVILSMSGDTDTRRAIVRVIYWLAVCCYVVGAERERTTDQPAWQPGRQAARWSGRQLG